MNRNITDPPALSSRIQDIRVAISPSRVQIYRPINPELTPLRQNKSDVYRYAEKEQNIISPFQKDQFLN
jgi:predicted metallo-beta-lactamase superfamily hydrolase